MSSNSIYQEHYLGIPLNAPYDDGILVRNPGVKSPKVKGKGGQHLPYSEWEKEHFKGTIKRGRPKLYKTEEERKEARRVYARKNYQKKKEQERLDNIKDKIKIIGSK